MHTMKQLPDLYKMNRHPIKESTTTPQLLQELNHELQSKRNHQTLVAHDWNDEWKNATRSTDCTPKMTFQTDFQTQST